MNMRRLTFVFRLALCYFLGSALLLVCGASATERHPAVVLLDVSGSMEREGGFLFQRYSAGHDKGHSQMQELANNLGGSIDRHCQCPVYLGLFSSSHEPSPVQGPLKGSQLGASTPATARGQETELDYALRLGLNHGSDGLIFIITDNKNDFHGSKSDQQFYSMLATDPHIHTVYFVPLGAENSTRDALVLYGLASGQGSRDVLRTVVSEFANSVKSEAVQFRPLYEQEKGHPQLGFSQHFLRVAGDGDEMPTEMEGDSIVVQHEEGRPLEGGLKFKLHSNLKHWRIIDGELKQMQVSVEVPEDYLTPGHSELRVTLPGTRKLNVAPGGESAEIYFLPLNGLDDAGVNLTRAGLFRTNLADVPLKIRLQAVITLAQKADAAGLQPALSPALQKRMQAVQNLPEIMNAMTFQTDSSSASNAMERIIPVSRDLLVRVHPDPVKNALARGILFGIPLVLLLGAGSAFMFLRPQAFSLVEPDGRARTLRFSLANRRARIQWSGRNAYSIIKRGGAFDLVADSGFRAEPSRLRGVPASFSLTKLASGERVQYQLRPGAAGSKSVGQGGSR